MSKKIDKAILNRNLSNFLKTLKKDKYSINENLINTSIMSSMNINEIQQPFAKIAYFGYFPEIFLKNLEPSKLSKIQNFDIFSPNKNLLNHSESEILLKNPSKQFKLEKHVKTEEELNSPNHYDLIISNINLQYNQNISKSLQNINSSLKQDGCFLGHIPGSNCFKELRNCFYNAENSIYGGYSQRVMKFPEINKFANVLNSKNFQMVSVFKDFKFLEYDGVFQILKDFKNQGVNNCLPNSRSGVYKRLFLEMERIYKENYPTENGGVKIGYEMIRFVGYKYKLDQMVRKGSVSLDKIQEFMEEEEGVFEMGTICESTGINVIKKKTKGVKDK